MFLSLFISLVSDEFAKGNLLKQEKKCQPSQLEEVISGCIWQKKTAFESTHGHPHLMRTSSEQGAELHEANCTRVWCRLHENDGKGNSPFNEQLSHSWMAFYLLRQTPKMNCQDKSQNGIIVECNQSSLGLGDLDLKRMLLDFPFAIFIYLLIFYFWGPNQDALVLGPSQRVGWNIFACLRWLESFLFW